MKHSTHRSSGLTENSFSTRHFRRSFITCLKKMLRTYTSVTLAAAITLLPITVSAQFEIRSFNKSVPSYGNQYNQITVRSVGENMEIRTPCCIVTQKGRNPAMITKVAQITNQLWQQAGDFSRQWSTGISDENIDGLTVRNNYPLDFQANSNLYPTPFQIWITPRNAERRIERTDLDLVINDTMVFQSDETVRGQNILLRKEVFENYLRTNHLDEVFPDWIMDGLSSYFSGVDYLKSTARQKVTDEIDNPRLSEDMFYYMVYGNDGENSAVFFQSLASINQYYLQNRVTTGRVHTDHAMQTRVQQQIDTQLTDLFDRTLDFDQYRLWLKDHRTGQPMYKFDPPQLAQDWNSLPEDVENMIVIMKLAKRYEINMLNLKKRRHEVEPRVNVISFKNTQVKPGIIQTAYPYYTTPDGNNPTQQSTENNVITKSYVNNTGSGSNTGYGNEEEYGNDDQNTSDDIVRFRKALFENRMGSMSILDAHGNAVLENDRVQWLTQLFDQKEYKYSLEKNGDTMVMKATSPIGVIYKAWFEKDPQNPKRPVLNLKRENTDIPSIKPDSDNLFGVDSDN